MQKNTKKINGMDPRNIAFNLPFVKFGDELHASLICFGTISGSHANLTRLKIIAHRCSTYISYTEKNGLWNIGFYKKLDTNDYWTSARAERKRAGVPFPKRTYSENYIGEKFAIVLKDFRELEAFNKFIMKIHAAGLRLGTVRISMMPNSTALTQISLKLWSI